MPKSTEGEGDGEGMGEGDGEDCGEGEGEGDGGGDDRVGVITERSRRCFGTAGVAGDPRG